MLGDSTVNAVVAVKDLDAARKFYGDTLGLHAEKDDPGGGVLYKSGTSYVFVYPSQFAGTNQATAASWTVDNIEAVVEQLKGKGVKFEHYDVPGTTREGDVQVIGQLKAAWFKDPDGNILGLTNGAM